MLNMITKTTAAKPTKIIPSLLSNAGYLAEVEKLVKLQTEHSELDRRVGEMNSSFAARQKRPEKSAAERFLDGDDAGTTTIEKLQQDMGAIIARKRLVFQAIELQRQRLAAARYAASARICEQLKPHHRKCRAICRLP